MNGKELLNFANKLEDDHKDKGYKWLYDKLRYDIIKKHQEAINFIPCCTELPSYYSTELDKIDQLQQTQASTRHQLEVLRVFANRLGLYDASDYLKQK